MRKIWLSIAALVLLASPAFAQVGGGVTFIPPITPGHCAKWYTSNILQDGGAGCGGSAGTITVGTTVVANGTSGRALYDNAGVLGELLVSQSATALALVQRDSNGNIFSNNVLALGTVTVGAGGTTVLTAASTRYQALTTAAQTYQLPDARTLTLGPWFAFNNNSPGALTITNAGSSTIFTVPAGGIVQCGPTDISTANGTWDCHSYVPSTVSWGTGATGLQINNVLTTTAQISSGAASSTAPNFIPQRGASTTGFGGDGTNLYGTIAGTAVLTIASTGITSSGRVIGGGNAGAIVTTGLAIYSGGVYAATSGGTATGTIDSGISRASAGVFAVGNGTNGNASGGLTGATLNFSGSGIQFTGLTTGTNADVVCYKSDGTLLIQAAASCTISDPDLKTDKHVYSAALLNAIDKLRPWTFRFKDWRENSDPNAASIQLGLMATDIAKAVPLCATYYDDHKGHVLKKPKGWREDCMIAALVGSIRELKAANDNLSRRLAKVENSRGTPR